MAIVQISKIIHRTGDLLDLPQLDIGEVGFTTDSKQLFIGNDPNNSEDDAYGKKHTEILTSATPLYFSQFAGSQDTTINISNNVANGQLIVAAVAENSNVISWTNKGGVAGGLIDLGHTNDVKLHGGLPGYILQTDGTGNLTWTTNGVLKYDIASISNATPAVVTIKVNDPTSQDYDPAVPIILNHNLTTGSAVTISSVQGATLSGTNGTNRFFVKYIDETTFSLWTNPNCVDDPVTISGTAIANTGFVLGYIVDPTGAEPLGSDSSVQYNDSGSFGGSNKFTFNKTSGNVLITGNLSVANVTAVSLTGEAGNLSNIRGSNVVGNVATSVLAYSIAGANVSGAVAFATTANAVAGANVSGAVAFATTANAVAGANVSGQVNFANVANRVAGGNVSGNVATAVLAYSVAGANVSGEVNYAAWANGVSGSAVSGQVNFANVANNVAGANVSGNVGFALTAFSISGANVSGAVNLATFATTANAVAGANVSGAVAFATTANSVAASNITGTISFATTSTTATSATTAGTVTTAAQPNITSVGTLSNITFGNTATATLTDVFKLSSSTNNLYMSTDATGISISTKPNQIGTGFYLVDSTRNVYIMMANATAGQPAIR